MTRSPTRRPPQRKTYHHGDLRHALLESGVQLAREGGPDAVVLREATRRVGVVPNAAYRHFANHEELLQAVRSAAWSAMAVTIEEELATLPRSGQAIELAGAGLRAIGAGYLRFARSETGLFRTIFSSAFDRPPGSPDPAKTGRSGLTPFQLLGAALDRLVEVGVLPAQRRPGAEFLAWSAVHGMALLVIDGPMRDLPQGLVQTMEKRLLEMVEKGL